MKQAGLLTPGNTFSPYPALPKYRGRYYSVQSMDYDYSDHKAIVNVGRLHWYSLFPTKFRISAHIFVEFREDQTFLGDLI